MKALKIHVDVPGKFVHAVEDREFLRVGQKLTGWVQLDEPRRPRSSQVRWVDGHGRVLGRTGGEYDAYARRLNFRFDLDQNPFWVHYIECDLEGRRQAERTKFYVCPTTQGWETMPAITWATYPYGDYYDRLKEVGVNGQIAYRMSPFEATVENAMRFYVDQCSYWEISLYHRPFKAYWEDAPIPRGSVGSYARHWQSLIGQYKRLRAQAKKEGVRISRNEHCRKLLWRKECPNDPGTVKIAGDQFAAVVRQHKGFRPLFQNIADEAGITDQTRPFDFCYCPWCMDKFRLRLQARYGTLGELNRQWGTDFANWDEVFPLTCDETMDANARAAGGLRGSRTRGGSKGVSPLNFASWADHREFMDDTFAHFFHQMAEVGRQVDPIGTFSQGGCQWPTVYGGWDYARVTRTVDAIIPYNLGGNQEIIRSIRPDLKNLSPFFGDDERHIRGLWYAYVHGDAGVIFWDNDEKTGRFVTRPSGKLSRRGRRFGPALREIRGGYAQQFAAWPRMDDPIGLLYSQPTERAHWMLESMGERGKIEWFDRVYRSRYVHVRFSWQQLIEDRQLQYRYVSYLDIDEKRIDLAQFRLLVLPETIAVSDGLVAALRDFVSGGGVLVADGRAGQMSGNCRQQPAGLLDDLFGVVHGRAVGPKSGPALRPVGRDRRPWIALHKGVRRLRASDSALRLAPGSGAEAAASAGPAPAIIRRKVGAGWAVYLNADVIDYELDRFRTGSDRGQALRQIFDALADMAGIERAVTVEEPDAGTSAGIELTRWGQRGGRMFAALLNRPWRVSGVGETLKDEAFEDFEKDRRVTLAFPDKAHTWNSRSGQYLGLVDRISARLPRLTPLIVSRLPYRVRGLEVTSPGRVAAGGPVQIAARLKVAGEPADHVLRVDVHQPDGQWCHWYSGTVTARDGAAAHSIRLAFNDPPGVWRITVRDTVTGTTVHKQFRVTRA